MKKDMLKKYAAIVVVVGGLMFGGTQAHAVSQNAFSSSFSQKLTIVTQLMSIMKEYPEFEDVIKPIVEEHLAGLFANLDTEYKNYGQEKKAEVHAKKEIKKDHLASTAYTLAGLEEIEVKPYENIDGKWQIDIEFDGDKEYTLYVYDVADEDELVEKIVTTIKEKFGFKISESDVRSVLDIDED